MPNTVIYLDSYTLQSDSRIRLPKSAIENIGVVPGKTRFNILLDTETNDLILRVVSSETEHTNGC